jgi:uncharacterized protein YjiS (DUF1127 family)
MFKSTLIKSTDTLWPYVVPGADNDARNVRHTIGATMRRWRASLAAWWWQRQCEHELRSLDDRMLRDIGIDRSEISRVVRYGRYE